MVDLTGCPESADHGAVNHGQQDLMHGGVDGGDGGILVAGEPGKGTEGGGGVTGRGKRAG